MLAHAYEKYKLTTFKNPCDSYYSKASQNHARYFDLIYEIYRLTINRDRLCIQFRIANDIMIIKFDHFFWLTVINYSSLMHD